MRAVAGRLSPQSEAEALVEARTVFRDQLVRLSDATRSLKTDLAPKEPS